MTTITQRRDEQVSTFFVTHADRLQRAVRHVNRVGEELIEDACQMAWTDRLAVNTFVCLLALYAATSTPASCPRSLAPGVKR